jgi:F-type H+-transporting ATPase subunit b
MSAEAVQLATEAAKETARAGVLGTLGVDWRLFLAQLANFAVVLLVMWKWVYVPLLRLVEERGRKVEQGLKDAAASAAAKEAAEREAQAAMSAARKEAQRLIEEASARAEDFRREAGAQAKIQAETLLAETRARLEAERVQVVHDARLELASLVVTAAEKAVGEHMTEAQKAAMAESAAKHL